MPEKMKEKHPKHNESQRVYAHEHAQCTYMYMYQVKADNVLYTENSVFRGVSGLPILALDKYSIK